MTDSLTALLPAPLFTADPPGSGHLAGLQRRSIRPQTERFAAGASAVPIAQAAQR